MASTGAVSARRRAQAICLRRELFHAAIPSGVCNIAYLAAAFNLLSNCDFKASIFVALICVLVCTFAPQLFLDPCSQAEPATLDKVPLLTKMAPSVSDVRPSATSTPVSKLAQTTPDDKTTEDPRDDNLRRAIASHTFGGAANLRDVFTNQEVRSAAAARVGGRSGHPMLFRHASPRRIAHPARRHANCAAPDSV
ncbi:hypothetical protein L1887_43416 [Cichorium endivia]|nr:hypothetical protein L1887_43416 [Cichorium endivia]